MGCVYTAMSAISATPPMHNTTGMRRQIRHACAGQTMKIETVPGPLRWQREARSFYSGPLAACRLYVRHSPLLAHSNFVTSLISLQSMGRHPWGGDCKAAWLASTLLQNKHKKIQPVADFGCASAPCVSLVGPVAIVVCFATRVAEQWLTKLFYVPVRIQHSNDNTKQKKYIIIMRRIQGLFWIIPKTATI